MSVRLPVERVVNAIPCLCCCGGLQARALLSHDAYLIQCGSCTRRGLLTCRLIRRVGLIRAIYSAASSIELPPVYQTVEIFVERA